MSATIEHSAKLGSKSSGTPTVLNFVKQHDLLTFYVLAFAISWGAILLALGPDGFISTGETMAVAGVLSLAGPSIAGLLMTGLVDGRAGLRLLGARLRRWRVGAGWYAVALLTGPFVMGVTAFSLSLISSEFRPDVVTADDKLGIIAAGVAVGLFGPFLEELGWTGFAVPKWLKRHGVFTTGLVMGLLWGVWHWPLFAGTTDPDGVVPQAVVVALLLFAWLPPYRVLMVWVYDRTESVLMGYLMHVPITATAWILATEARTGAAAVVPVLVWGAVLWAMVAAVAWANGGHLDQRARAQETSRIESPGLLGSDRSRHLG